MTRKERGPRTQFRCLLLASLSLSVVACPRASAQPAAHCQVWRQVPSPGVEGGALGDASATSATDVWAVGGNGYTPIIEHWDGSSWTLDSTPQPRGSLGGVAAVASDDAWAVGNLEQGTGSVLVEHWDGTAWSRYPVPSPGQYDYLSGVSALSADDIWAAGFYTASDGHIAGLAEHYDGTAWSVVPMDDMSSLANVMRGVHAVASDDVWTVGYQEVSFSVNQALAEHWDGTSWTAVPMALPPPSLANTFWDVSASSSTDVWAVGSYGGHFLPSWSIGTRPRGPATRRREGRPWRSSPSPPPTPGQRATAAGFGTGTASRGSMSRGRGSGRLRSAV